MSSVIQPLALSPDDAATFLGISRRKVYLLLEAELIKGRRLGGRTLIDAASVRRYYETLPAFVSAPIPNSPQMLAKRSSTTRKPVTRSRPTRSSGKAVR